jgi:5'-deoxynucleotidase YfbR-like HD superfamily hydrolase
MNINDILLAQNIKRWTIVSTMTDQSLAEHSFNVAMIARAIAAEAEMNDINIIKYALDHDLDEVMTGDIPSPAKTRMGMSTMASGKTDLFYRGKSAAKCNEAEAKIVVAADLIDSYLFIKHNKIGRHAEQVYKYTRHKFEMWMEALHKTHPTVYGAVENTLAMLEFGKFDTEIRDGK